MPSRTCILDGCDKPVAGKAKYCSDNHRTTYNRRKKAEAKRAREARKRPTLPEDPAVQKALAKELETPMQEALSEDVVEALQNAVKLTPQALQKVADLLESDLEHTRLAAAQTILKYTIGQNALLPNMDSDKQPLTVVIEGLDRPPIETQGQKPLEQSELTEALEQGEEHSEPYRICDFCRIPKPESEFIGNSNRCIKCFTELRDGAEARLGV